MLSMAREKVSHFAEAFREVEGLKLAVVERHVTQAYGVRLKIMEGEAEGTDR